LREKYCCLKNGAKSKKPMQYQVNMTLKQQFSAAAKGTCGGNIYFRKKYTLTGEVYFVML